MASPRHAQDLLPPTESVRHLDGQGLHRFYFETLRERGGAGRVNKRSPPACCWAGGSKVDPSVRRLASCKARDPAILTTRRPLTDESLTHEKSHGYGRRRIQGLCTCSQAARSRL